MNTAIPKNKLSGASKAEAAAWVARLHGPNRTPEVEAGFRRWMSEDPERAAAVEFITDTWEKSARLRRRPLEELRSWELPAFRISFLRAALATAAIAVLAVVSTLLFLRTDRLTTSVGELRTLTLEDGTRVYLNTDTRVVPLYDRKVRRVELEKGEALFEVARSTSRPFVVTVGDHQIRALGTSFVVRRDEGNLAVTLVEGKVSVVPGAPEAVNSDMSHKGTRFSSPAGLILRPGERVTMRIAELAVQAAQGKDHYSVDKPAIERVIAWQRGQVSFDETMLADAVAEMNRYSRMRLVIKDPGTAAIRISGIFRAGDQENFAQAVSRTYGIRSERQDLEIILAGSGDATE